MEKRVTLLAVLIGLFLALAACAPAAAPPPTPTKAPAASPTVAAASTKPPAPASTPTVPAATPTPRPATVKWGTLQAVSDVGLYVAIDKGYFKEQGITIDVNNVRSTAEAIPSLSTGQLDMMTGSLSQALITAADRGIEFKIVAEKGQSIPKWETLWVVLRKDLADSGKVKTPADLKGLKIAFTTPGSVADQIIQKMLEQAGLKRDDVEVIDLPIAEQAAAFGNKAIAAGFGYEPFIARGVQEGFSVKWLPSSSFFDGKLQSSVIVFGPTLNKDADLARRVLIGYLKGARYYLKNFNTKDGRDEIVNILVKYTSVKDPKLFDVMEMPYADPNGQLDKKSVDAQYKFYVDKGLYTGKRSFSDITDTSYLDYAVQVLGKQ